MASEVASLSLQSIFSPKLCGCLGLAKMRPEPLCWPILGLCWPICCLCWGHVRPSWGYVGAMLAHFGAMLDHVAGDVGPSGTPRGDLAAMLFS